MPEKEEMNKLSGRPRRGRAVDRLKKEFGFRDEEIRMNKEFSLFDGSWGEDKLHKLIDFIKTHSHELRKPTAKEIAYLAPLYAKGIIEDKHMKIAIETIKKHAEDPKEWGWDDVGKLSYAATMHMEHLDEVAKTLIEEKLRRKEKL